MQPGEGKAQLGQPLQHSYFTVKDRTEYELRYCPCCLTLFRQVVDRDVEALPSENV